ncbi:MAG TPA: VOC family protein [Euzebyales bacterium]|nr:VOC family protein [Euzebyales bacterium]
MSITGAHVIIHSNDAEADRVFVRDVLGFDAVDAGGGWLIFALPPAELAVHPTEAAGAHELYLMCDDIAALVDDLAAKDVEIVRPVSDEGWGLLASFRLPSGAVQSVYQPRHPVAHDGTSP